MKVYKLSSKQGGGQTLWKQTQTQMPVKGRGRSFLILFRHSNTPEAHSVEDLINLTMLGSR